MQADAFRRLGILYENKGNITKAEDLLLKSYKIYQELFGEHHLEVAAITDCLGWLYCNMGNVVKAEEFLLNSLEIYQLNFGENHRHVAELLGNLGTLYIDMWGGTSPKLKNFS